MGGGAMHVDLPTVHFRPPSSASSSSALFPSLPQPPPPNLSFPVSINTTPPLKRGEEDERNGGSASYNAFLGPVPSRFEVENALSSLQDFVQGSSSSGSEFDRFRQMLEFCFDAGTVLSNGYGRFREAFDLLQTEPSIKRLVVSLSSDKALWDAVMNNEMVRKLLLGKESLVTAENHILRSNEAETDQSSSMLRWIVNLARAAVIELIRKFQLLMDEVFQHLEKGSAAGEATHKVDDKIRSSLLLSVVVLLIVVLARA